MQLNGIESVSAVKDFGKVNNEQHDVQKTAFINSAFGFGFNGNNNSGDACAFQA